MPLTLPDECIPAVLAIRLRVPRPAERPGENDKDDERLRFPPRTPAGCGRCPLGLIPGATSAPANSRHVPDCGLTDENIRAFANWWDGLFLADADAAMDLVWGPDAVS